MLDRKLNVIESNVVTLDTVPSVNGGQQNNSEQQSELSDVANRAFEATRSGDAKTFLQRSRQPKSGE